MSQSMTKAIAGRYAKVAPSHPLHAFAVEKDRAAEHHANLTAQLASLQDAKHPDAEHFAQYVDEAGAYAAKLDQLSTRLEAR